MLAGEDCWGEGAEEGEDGVDMGLSWGGEEGGARVKGLGYVLGTDAGLSWIGEKGGVRVECFVYIWSEHFFGYVHALPLVDRRMLSSE
jgi:hypothetical protein